MPRHPMGTAALLSRGIVRRQDMHARKTQRTNGYIQGTPSKSVPPQHTHYISMRSVPLSRESATCIWASEEIRSALMWGMRTLAERGHIRIDWMRSCICIAAYAENISLAKAVVLRITESVKNIKADDDR